MTLEAIFANLEAALRGRPRVRVGRIFAALGRRGYGSMLVVLAMFQILPTGAIPGMPDVVAVGTLVVAYALVRRRPMRLPRWLRKRELGTETLLKGIVWLRPLARRLGARLRPRLQWVIEGRTAEIVLSLVLVTIALIIVALGMIPYLPFTFALVLALIGAGLITHDGKALLAAYAILAVLLAVLPMVLLWVL